MKTANKKEMKSDNRDFPSSLGEEGIEEKVKSCSSVNPENRFFQGMKVSEKKENEN